MSRVESYNGTRLVFHDGWIEITVPGHPTFQAVAEDTAEYRARAFALGFTDPETGATNVDAMNAEHDRAHAFLAKRLGLRVSPVLEWIAMGRPTDDSMSGLDYVRDAEEQFVLAYHRYRNALIHAGLWTRPL